MSRKNGQPMEVYVRHQSGPSSVLTFHLNLEQRQQLIEALATGSEVEMAAQLKLSVLSHCISSSDGDTLIATIPVRLLSFNVDPTR